MNQDLRRKLDHIIRILRAGGLASSVAYIEQLSYLIYLKLLDQEENTRTSEVHLISNDNARSLFRNQAERYRWSQWHSKDGAELRDFLRDEVFPYMGSLVQEEPQIAEYFRDAVLEIVDAHVLRQVVDELDSIDFQKLGTDVTGGIFEYLLTHLKDAGDLLYTPRQIRAMMVELVDPDVGDTIYDPACGTGGFLVDTVKYILAKYSSEPIETPIFGEERLEQGGQTIAKRPGEQIPDWEKLEGAIYGFDVSRQMMRIAVMNLVLHGIRNARVRRANTLSEIGGLSDEDLRRKYRVILSNPPLAGVLPRESIRRDLPTNSKRSELLFMGVMMESLAPGGRCAVIVPEGLLLSSASAHVELQRKLVEEYELQAVISLPAGAFKPATSIKTGVLVFRRPTDRRVHGDKVWFYEVIGDGYDLERMEGDDRSETPERNDIPELLRLWREYRASGFAVPPGPESSTPIEVESTEIRYWWVSKETLAANDYCLAADRYKPQVIKAALKEDPTALLRDILGIEQKITLDLEQLLQDINA